MRVSILITCQHTVGLEQIEAVMSTLRSSGESTQHADVRHVEGRRQQVTRMTDELV